MEVQPVQIMHLTLHILQKMPVLGWFSLTCGWAVDLELVPSAPKMQRLCAELSGSDVLGAGISFPPACLCPCRGQETWTASHHPTVCGISDSPCIHFWSHKGHQFKADLRHRLVLAI